MATAKKTTVRRRREKKTLSAVPFISSPPLTIRLLLLLMFREIHCLNPAPEHWASGAPENPHRLLHRLLRKPLQELQWSMV